LDYTKNNDSYTISLEVETLDCYLPPNDKKNWKSSLCLTITGLTLFLEPALDYNLRYFQQLMNRHRVFGSPIHRSYVIFVGIRTCLDSSSRQSMLIRTNYGIG
jgi:hypothetical protein